MKIILSNANRQKRNIDELITIAGSNKIKAIEWKVFPEDIHPYISIEAGNDALNNLKMKLVDLGIEIYGICLEVTFNILQSAVFAKQCLDMLKSLGGKLLRIIMKPIDMSLITDRTYGGMIDFLNSLGRYASYTAGGGGHSETTVRLAYDLLSQTTLDITDLLRVNNSLTNRSLGISLDPGRFPALQKYTQILRECNQNEFSLYQISVNENITESRLRSILAETVQVYDGPLAVKVGAGNPAQIARVKTLAKDYQFDPKAYDYTKMSCPSTTARIIRAYGKASLTPPDDIEVGTLVEIFGIVLLDVAFNTGRIITDLSSFLLIHLQTDRIDQVDQRIEEGMDLLIEIRLKLGKARGAGYLGQIAKQSGGLAQRKKSQQNAILRNTNELLQQKGRNHAGQRIRAITPQVTVVSLVEFKRNQRGNIQMLLEQRKESCYILFPKIDDLVKNALK